LEKHEMPQLSLFFESHATSIDNEIGIASGWNDPQLSPKGIQQAIELGKRYETQKIDIVFVSDLCRAYQTATLAFSKSSVRIIQDPRLREWNYGKLNGAPVLEVEHQRHLHIHTAFPEGESFDDVMLRFASFKNDLLKKESDKRVLVIGHRATYYALEWDCNKILPMTIMTLPWIWKPCRQYILE
jgi:broad specificity phosphatase PhoE